MPYKSRAQQRLFHHLVSQGKLAPEVAHEYDVETKGKKIPQYVKRKAFGGEVEAKEGVHCPACDYPLDSAPVAMDAGEGCPRCGFGSAKEVPHKARGGMIHRYAEGGEVESAEDDEPMTAQRQKVREHLSRLMGAVGEGLKGGEQKRRYRPFDAMPKQGQESMPPTTYRAHGGEVQCAHCGSVSFVPLKAMGGEVGDGLYGDMKELYPRKRDPGAHLDDGKSHFGKALKRRR